MFSYDNICFSYESGPEIRTGLLPGNADVLEISDGQEVVVTFQEVHEKESKDATGRFFLNIDYPSIATSVQVKSNAVLGIEAEESI
jgi:hypothetical protein